MLENIINIKSLKDSFSVSLSNYFLEVKLKFIDNTVFSFSKKNDHLLLDFLEKYKNFFNKSIDFQKCFHIDIQDSWITESFYAGTSHSSNKIPFKKISINILDDILSTIQWNLFFKMARLFYNCSSILNLNGKNFVINYKSFLKLAYLVNNGFVNLDDTFDNVKWSESFSNDSLKNPGYVVFFDLNNNKKLRVNDCTKDILNKFDGDGKSFFSLLFKNS